MYNKFDRNYVLTIEPYGEPSFTISRPFTIEFDVSRNTFGDANYAQIRIYNLSQYHRNLIRHDVTDQNAYKPLNITLQAGYGNGPLYPVIFVGNAQVAYSKRQGNNFITTIEGFDGGAAIQNATTNLPVAEGTSWDAVINSTLQDLTPYGIKVGAVAPYEGFVSKGFGLSGRTIDILNQLTGNAAFIDNKVVNVLPYGFAIGNAPFITIDSSTGLLNTPSIQQSIIDIEILFEPRIVVGTTIKLNSVSSTAANGIHQVVGVMHRGTISSAVAGTATTTIRAVGGVFSGIVSQFLR